MKIVQCNQSETCTARTECDHEIPHQEQGLCRERGCSVSDGAECLLAYAPNEEDIPNLGKCQFEGQLCEECPRHMNDCDGKDT